MHNSTTSLSGINRALKAVVCWLMVCISSVAAHAAAPVDWGDMELGKAYNYTTFTANGGKFTAPQSGVLTCTSTCGDFLYPYSDAEHTQELNFQTNYDSQGHIYYELSVTEGQEIYFYKSFVMNSGSWILTMSSEEDVKLNLVSTTPEAGAMLSPAGSPQVLFYFSQNVKISGAEIVVGDYSQSISANLSGSTVFFNCGDDLMALLNAGKLQENDIITFRLKNVRMAANESVLYGEDGTCEVSYVCAGNPVKLVSVSGLLEEGNKFLSYWVKGDPRGILTATFDGDLQVPEEGSQSQVLTLGFGNSEGEVGEYYSETIPYTVNGNVLTVDLTGKLRTPENMVTSGTNYGLMLLKLVNVRDAKGNYVYSSGLGTLGSFSYDMAYEEVKSSFTAEFTPASGESLAGKEKIELWITDYEKLHFDGILFTAGETSVVSTDFTATPDPEFEGAYILDINIPAEMKDLKGVTVTLNNLVCEDGRDHSLLFTAKYDSFMLKKVQYKASADAVPVNLSGARLEKLLPEAKILVNTNMNDKVGYAWYQIRDLNPTTPDEAIVKSMATLYKGEDGSFSAEIYGAGYKLMLGHTYRMEVTAYASEDDYNYGNDPLGTDYIEFSGATPPYVYSPTQFVSIDPANETTLTEASDTEFTLEFDGMVSLDASTTFVVYGMGETLPFKSIEAVEPADGLSNIWKLTVDAGTLSSVGNTLTLSLVATDYEGRRVQGNEGEDENTYFRFTYPLNFANFEVTITPASGTEVEKLHQFTVSCTEGIGDAYSGQDIVLYNRGEFTAVAKVSNIEQIIPEDQMDNLDYVVQSLLLTLDTEITDAGAYVLDVPAGVFNLGTQFNQSHNAAFAANYTIKAGGSGSDANVEATPANGSTVKELSKVELVFPDEDEISIGSGLPTLSKDGGEPTKLNDAELDWDVYNKAILNFTPALTEAGVYTITFPEGYFLGTYGNPLPGFSLTYTVSVQDGITHVQLSTSGNEAVYTISGLRVNPSRRLPAGTYIVGGKKVVVK
ncbi:MAG: Ig-like domain-containing protein [Bacteroidales bacterium]|nr:Ig-like domain-containing protein [Bacteroidales bacterium]